MRDDGQFFSDNFIFSVMKTARFPTEGKPGGKDVDSFTRNKTVALKSGRVNQLQKCSKNARQN